MQHRNRALYIIMFVSISIYLFVPTAAWADMGPQPTIKITVKNAPQQYYLDLLTPINYRDYSELQNQVDYGSLDVNEIVVQKFYSLEKDGWYPEKIQVWQMGIWSWDGVNLGANYVNEDGYPCHSFRNPVNGEGYRVMIVTEDGDSFVTDVMKHQTIWSYITIDYKTGEVTKKPACLVYLAQFCTTFIGTIVIEGILFILFGLLSKRNIGVFFITNLITQTFLTCTMGVAMIHDGIIMAGVIFFIAELGILIAETLIYRGFMEFKSKERVITYGIVANLASFLIGFTTLSEQFNFLARFM